MIVHPKNPDIAYAAVLGNAFGPNAERGVYRTTDGGKTWKQVLFKDDDTGAIDVCFDPTNPRILFAGLWQTRRQAVGADQRRPRQRPVRLARRRRHLDSSSAPEAGTPAGKEVAAAKARRLAGGHLGQGRRGRRPVGLASASTP